MPKLVVRAFTISLDGYSAAPQQSLDEPFGKGGIQLVDWLRATESFHAVVGESGGERGIDNDFAVRADDNIGATIMGVIRNGLVLLQVSSYWQELIIGSIIVLAAVLDRLRARRSKG